MTVVTTTGSRVIYIARVDNQTSHLNSQVLYNYLPVVWTARVVETETAVVTESEVSVVYKVSATCKLPILKVLLTVVVVGETVVSVVYK